MGLVCMTMMMMMIALCAFNVKGGSSIRPVVIGLQSAWSHTPLIQEASEWFASEDTGLFWDFALSCWNASVSPSSSDRQQYEHAMAVASSIFSGDQVSVLRISLAGRAHSVAVEAHRAMAKLHAPAKWLSDKRERVVDDAFAVVGDVAKVVTTVAELERHLEAHREGNRERNGSHLLVDGDHIYGGSAKSGSTASIVVIVYGNLGTLSAKRFHDALVAREDVIYVLRHRPPFSAKRVRVPGFGVEMHLKSTEYKVVDDSHAAAASSAAPVVARDQDDFELEPVPKAEVASLGIKIAQAITTSSQPLEMLQRLSQNFPSECHLFRQQLLNASFVESVRVTQKRVQRGHTAVLINGRHLPVENVNFFELITVLSEEIRRFSQLRDIVGLSAKAVRALTIKNDASSGSQGEAAPYFDLRSSHLFWANDIERDDLYRSWRKSLQGYLQQQWPGQPYLVRRNVFHVVFVADLGSHDALDAIESVWSVVGFLEHGTLGATRLGIVPVGSSPSSIVLAKAWRVLVQEDPHKAMSMLKAAQAVLLSPKSVESIVENHLASLGLTLDLLMESEDSYPGTEASNKWSTSFGFPSPTLEPLHVFVNGKRCLLDGQMPPLHVVARAAMEMTRELQMVIYQQKLKDADEDIHAWWLSSHQAQKAFSAYGGASDGKSPFVSLAKPHALEQLKRHLHFTGTCDPYCHLSYIVLIDVSSKQGLQQAQKALERLQLAQRETREEKKDLGSVRMAFVWHQSSRSQVGTLLSAELETALRGGELHIASSLLEVALAGLSHPHVKVTEAGRRLQESRSLEGAYAFVMQLLGDAAAPTSVILNGRVFGLHDVEQNVLNAADFSVIEAHEMRKRAQSVGEILQFSSSDQEEASKSDMSDRVMVVCSILGTDETKGVLRYDMREILPQTPPTSSGTNPEAKIVIDALLDPLSNGGKKFSSILLKILSSFQAEVNLWLNPVLELSDLPLKQYYRYVAATDLHFDVEGSIDNTVDHRALFEKLPSKTLFSMSLDVPDHWVVDTVAAPYDLDNLRIADVGATVDKIGAMYELTHLLVEGNCKDSTPGSDPKTSQVRGIQLKLTSPADDSQADESLVMEMAGYFQLKSTPGVWQLALRGRSAELYQILKNQPVVVRSFTASSRPLNVARKNLANMEPLLPPDSEADEKLQVYQRRRSEAHRRGTDAAAASSDGDSRGFFGSVFGSSEKKAPAAKTAGPGIAIRTIVPSNTTINVFSLASGHLYERFLSIMMYTAKRVTKAPLKFWFLKQFLSPQFKRSLPALAAKYGFDFELVSYHWPRWLRHQTEKQRVIWGYKILFLDVLFPLDVERVIFVDADQIVREDLNSLHTLDLEGAPYAFTPFCSLPENRRLETKGFRFWESGYWKDTLDGLPYHISALFVVDLKRFRQQAAGDVLRNAYHQLSADPGSLANLDQDLPNVLQRQLPIYSLPEEWLWCGTWCTDQSLSVAKSIDLCQNPMTKKSKLEMAKEIDPDWTTWDQELTQVCRTVDAESAKRDEAIIREL